MTETTMGSHLQTDHQLLSGYREDLPRKVNGARKVASVLSLNYRDTLRFKRRPSPLMGEGLGGGAGAAGKALQRRTLKPREPVSCRCFMLVPRS